MVFESHRVSLAWTKSPLIYGQFLIFFFLYFKMKCCLMHVLQLNYTHCSGLRCLLIYCLRTIFGARDLHSVLWFGTDFYEWWVWPYHLWALMVIISKISTFHLSSDDSMQIKWVYLNKFEPATQHRLQIFICSCVCVQNAICPYARSTFTNFTTISSVEQASTLCPFFFSNRDKLNESMDVLNFVVKLPGNI